MCIIFIELQLKYNLIEKVVGFVEMFLDFV